MHRGTDLLTTDACGPYRMDKTLSDKDHSATWSSVIAASPFLGSSLWLRLRHLLCGGSSTNTNKVESRGFGPRKLTARTEQDGDNNRPLCRADIFANIAYPANGGSGLLVHFVPSRMMCPCQPLPAGQDERLREVDAVGIPEPLTVITSNVAPGPLVPGELDRWNARVSVQIEDPPENVALLGRGSILLFWSHVPIQSLVSGTSAAIRRTGHLLGPSSAAGLHLQVILSSIPT